MPTIAHKRGDTFMLGATATDAAGQPINLTGYTVRAQVRRPHALGGGLVAALVVDVTHATAGQYTLRASGDGTTAQWPVGKAELDIEYEAGTGPAPGVRQVQSSQTLCIDVLRDVTQP